MTDRQTEGQIVLQNSRPKKKVRLDYMSPSCSV